MKNSIKLILASMVLAGAVNYAAEKMMHFNITNSYGKELHVKILDPETGGTLKGPIPVAPGDNISMEEIPKVVFAHYPSIEDSECGLVFDLEKLNGKCAYLVARPIAGKVRFTPLRKKENNICLKSIRKAKNEYEDWVKDMDKKGIKIEPMVAPAAVEVMEKVETGTVYCPKCKTKHAPPQHARCSCQRPKPLTIAGCSCQRPKPKLAKCPCQRPKPLTIAGCSSCQRPRPLV